MLVKPSEGETPAAADLTLIDDLVEPVVAQLYTSEVVAVGNPDAIDDQIFLPLAAYLANEAAPEFAQSKSEDARAIAERDIKRATAVNSFAQPLQAEYY